MSNDYVQKEIKKILDSNEYPQNMALASSWVIAHYKGVNIKIFDVSQVSSLCDYNIIASAENVTQARSMVDEIQYGLKQAGGKMISVEGVADGEWILLDMGDVIIHVFQEAARDSYALETLWAGCDQVQIPSEYYFGAADTETATETTENYF